jgi:hypothetical protein
MSHSRFSPEEVARRGKELYAKIIRAQVETAENIGKIVSIDIETGEYAVGEDLLVPAIEAPGCSSLGGKDWF